MPSPLLLRLHLLVTLAFLLFYAGKAFLLLTNRLETLRAVRARTRMADSLLGLLILVSGGALLFSYPSPIPTWQWLRMALLVLVLPLAIGALRRHYKPGVLLTLLGFAALVGLGDANWLTGQFPSSATSSNPTPPLGVAEASPTPEAAAPVDTAVATAGRSRAEAATRVAASEVASEVADTPETPAAANLVAGQTLFAQNCAVCHGADGRLGLNGARDLTRSDFTLPARVYMVKQGSLSKKMPSFQGKLTEEQIQQVAAYSLTLR